MKEGEKQRCVNGNDRDDRAAAIAIVDVGAIGHGSFNVVAARALRKRNVSNEKRRVREHRPALSTRTWRLVYRADAALRPPPWLAFPPLLAISRCFAGSIAAKPRFEPPLLVAAIRFLLVDGQPSQRDRSGAVHNADRD